MECENCGINCEKCEYKEINEPFSFKMRAKSFFGGDVDASNYFPICLRCKEGFFLLANLFDCDICDIEYCEMCFHGTVSDIYSLNYTSLPID